MPRYEEEQLDGEIELKNVEVEDDYTPVAVDTDIIPIASLATYLEGSPWSVNYYSQVLTEDSEVGPQQLGLDPVYQQYTKIINMEFRVTSPLTQSMNTPSNGMSVEGAASIYPFIVPNQGDMFTADIGDGRRGIFTVTESTRKTILRETAHEISYNLVAYAEGDRINDLESKVIKQVHFKRDFLYKGKNPLLLDDEVALIAKLRDWRSKLLSRYIALFFSNEYKTLLVPNQLGRTRYDHLLVSFFRRIFGASDHPTIRYMKELNADTLFRKMDYSVWDAMYDNDIDLFGLLTKAVKIVPCNTLRTMPQYRSVAYSGIDEVVMQSDHLPIVDEEPLEPVDPEDLPDEEEVPTVGTPELFYPVHKDGYYIFSKAFYDDGDNKSHMEIELLKLIQHQATDLNVLHQLAEGSLKWEKEEAFYYTPFILCLIIDAIRDI